MRYRYFFLLMRIQRCACNLLNIFRKHKQSACESCSTNTSCIPCVAANQYLDAVTNSNVIIIRWHTTLYPNDPFYTYNPTDSGARQTYYNTANANPQAFLLGKYMGNYNANNWTNVLNTQLAASRSMGSFVSKTYDTTSKERDTEYFNYQNPQYSKRFSLPRCIDGRRV